MTTNEELARIAKDLAKKLFEEAESKRVFKEALNEWLDHKFTEFGKWTLRGILIALFGALITIVMFTQGYHRP